jgi:hypothetical protein
VGVSSAFETRSHAGEAESGFRSLGPLDIAPNTPPYVFADLGLLPPHGRFRNQSYQQTQARLDREQAARRLSAKP